jgi:hypothetical protein
MKKLLLAFVLTTTAAFAGETLLLEVPAEDLGSRYDSVESKMFVDVETGEAKAIMTSYREYESCSWSGGSGDDPGRYECDSYSLPVKTLEAPLVDIRLEGKEVIFTGTAEAVSCGVIKRGRIFKNSTRLILNGNCTVGHKRIKKEGSTAYQLLLLTK